MGGFITVAMYAIVAWLSFAAGNTALGWVGVGLAAVSLWVWGVAHNFAAAGSAQRIRQLRENLMSAEGRGRTEAADGTADIPLRSEPQAVPNWLAMIHLGITILGAILLIIAFVTRGGH